MGQKSNRLLSLGLALLTCVTAFNGILSGTAYADATTDGTRPAKTEVRSFNKESEINSFSTSMDNKWNGVDFDNLSDKLEPKISVGSRCLFIIRDNGVLFAKGYNCYGELGSGTTQDYDSLTHIPLDFKVKAVSSGRTHTIFLDTEGNVYGCGENNHGQVGVGNVKIVSKPTKLELKNIVKISTFDNHTLFLDSNGDVYGCGLANKGQLGDGFYDDVMTPVKLNITDVKDIATSSYNSYFLKNNNDIFGCGDNYKGQLGFKKDKYNEVYYSIKQLPISSSYVVESIHTGNQSLYLKLSNGSVLCTGNGSNGELACGDIGTVRFGLTQMGFDDCKDFESGYQAAYYIDKNGFMYSTGYNSAGQLGINKSGTCSRYKWCKVSSNVKFKKLYRGYNSIYAVAENDDIYACGEVKELPTGSSGASCSMQYYKPEYFYGNVDLMGSEAIKEKEYILETLNKDLTKLESDYDNIKSRIEILPDSKFKSDCLIKLNDVDNYYLAIKCVEKVESTLDKTDYDIAKDNVDKLKINKNDLEKRLEEVLKKINEKNVSTEDTDKINEAKFKALISVAESTLKMDDYTKAEEVYNSIISVDIRQELSKDLSRVYILIIQHELFYQALDAVKQCEAETTTSTYLRASELIQKIVNERQMTMLRERLNKRLPYLLNNEKLKRATEAVEHAEHEKTSEAINIARFVVNELMDSVDKDELQARLDAIGMQFKEGQNYSRADLGIDMKVDSAIELSLSKSTVDMQNYNGIVDVDIPKAVQVKVSSNQPYVVDMTLLDGIKGSKGDRLEDNLFNIKLSDKKEFFSLVSGVAKRLVTGNQATEGDYYDLDFKMIAKPGVQVDNYRGSIRFEAMQE